MRYLLLILAALPALAQSLTPVADTIKDQFGNAYNGPLTISLSTPSVTSGGGAVLSVVRPLQIRGGVLSISLVPNDTATPSGSSYVFAFGSGSTKTCTFPTSASPLKLGPYCTDNAPGAIAPSIPLSWLAGVPSSGTACVQAVNGVVAWNACSGSSSLTLSTLTNAQLSSLTNSQLSALTN